MKKTFFIAGATPAVSHAAQELKNAGFPLVSGVQQADCILLDVPSFAGDGCLRSGGDPGALLASAKPGSVIFGGMLDHPLLEGRRIHDLLKLEAYLQENARITAHCVITVATQKLTTILPHTPTLVIGWGRIGKHLSRLLRAMGTPLTVSARADKDRALLGAIGYHSAPLEEIDLAPFRLIINTAPAALLDQSQLNSCPRALKLDLASKKGMEGPDVIWARGLPGLMTPESSGKLIANTILSILKEEKP